MSTVSIYNYEIFHFSLIKLFYLSHVILLITNCLPRVQVRSYIPVQCFLDRCFKRKYTSKPVSVYDFLERARP